MIEILIWWAMLLILGVMLLCAAGAIRLAPRIN